MVEVDSNTVVRRLAFELLGGFIEKTPVLTGYARASWNIAGDKANLEIPEAGQEAYSIKDQSHIPSAVRYYITNNLPYIQALEAGHSKQMDKGHMVTRTVNDVLANFEKLTKDLFK